MSDVPGACVEIASELAPNTAWQFAGQGSLKVNIGREIFNETESFRSAMLLCDGILFTNMGYRASDLLYPDISNLLTLEKASSLLQQTRYAQAVLVAYEYCFYQRCGRHMGFDHK